MVYKYSQATCGLKKTKKPDLALIFSDVPCAYAGVFTTNQVHAACVDENKKLLKRKKKVRLIVANSGNANACTGKKGILAVKKTKQIAARLLNIKPDEVLVASTGTIGVHLNMEKIRKGIERAIKDLSTKNLKKAAMGILTTDRFIKIVNVRTQGFKLTGFAKGAGMIHPDMATMLCFLMTDLKMPQQLLQNTLKEVTEDTFNTMTVDNDMSTNDMVILLSNNQSKKEVRTTKDPLYVSFKNVLYNSCLKLAEEIVKDGEGATKLIRVHVTGSKTKEDAKKIARSIAGSVLFKCAIFGADSNWGRIANKIGSQGIKINQSRLDISLNKQPVFRKGNLVNFNKEKLNKQMKSKKETNVVANLNLGNHSAFALGCDLSYEYVRLNSEYST